MKPSNREFKPLPIVNKEWWAQHVKYTKLDRQDLEITCASFENPNAKANIVVVTGWSECFLKYSTVIRTLYEEGFSVYTYDHQSQGFSGRWLPDTQSTWVRSFDDYTHDFIYFVTQVIVSDSKKLPIYVMAHSMGGFVAAVGMSRNPSLINRAVLLAPMLRMRCATKALNYRLPMPQPLAHWSAYVSWLCGLGPSHAPGYPNELYTDKLPLNTFTSDTQKLEEFEAMRAKYPSTIATCVTNDWVRHSLQAQIDFSRLYPLVRTNCLVFQASKDYFVYNRAMETFANQAGSVVLLSVPDTYHELLFERPEKRIVVENQILQYFHQATDDVKKCQVNLDAFEVYDRKNKMKLKNSLKSFANIVLRGSAVMLGSLGIVFGVSLLTGINTRTLYNLMTSIWGSSSTTKK